MFLKKKKPSNCFVCMISVNLTRRSQKRTEQTTYGSTPDVHDLYKRPGIFIASESRIHYNVNHRHTKLNANKPYLLWCTIRVFRPTHRVCNDTMENVMFQGDSTNSLSSVVINSWRFHSIRTGGALDWGTALQAGRSRVRFPMVSLEFFIDITLPAALRPWGRLSL
jgi:hypothetical protein